MRQDHAVEDEVRNSATQQKKDVPKPPKPGGEGPDWLFPLLMTIIALGVLGLILKSLGVF